VQTQTTDTWTAGRPHSLKAIAALARGLFLRLDRCKARLAQDSLSKKR
jgi:hypothetical protein